MAYHWQKIPDSQLLETLQHEPITFDSWVLITEDAEGDASGTPRTVLWFSSLEELALFVEERFLALWLPDGTPTDDVKAAARKLATARRVQPKLVAAFREALNSALKGCVHTLWIGTFYDLLDTSEPEAASISADLNRWFEDRGHASGNIDLDAPKQQRAAVEFFLQLGS